MPFSRRVQLIVPILVLWSLNNIAANVHHSSSVSSNERLQTINYIDERKLQSLPRERGLLQIDRKADARGMPFIFIAPLSVVSECTLSSESVERYLKNLTRTWTIDDDALEDLGDDVQAIVDCTREGDTIMFDISKSLRPVGRIEVPWRLTFSASIEDDLVDGIFPAASNKTTFVCPSKSEGVFLISSRGAVLANLVFVGCSLENAAIVEVTACEDDDDGGSLRIHHTQFSRNRLDASLPLLLNTPRCTAVEMVDADFDENVCVGGTCSVALSVTNRLVNVTVRGNDFSGPGVTRPPAVIYAPPQSTTVVEGMVARDNNATVLRVEGGNVTIDDSRFLRNSAESIGGGDASAAGVHLEKTTAVVKGSLFRENRAQSGATISASGSVVTLERTEFLANEAAKDGAAVYHVNGTVTDIDNCTFARNSADGSGAAIQSTDTDIRVIGTVFSNNSAARGAAIAAIGNRLDVRDCSFEGNYASIDGGGIAFVGDVLSVDAVSMIGNRANEEGGAILAEDSSLSSISNLTCERNVATVGGCVHVKATPLTLEAAFIQGNNAGGNGGGVSVRNATVNISSCVFQSNAAMEGGGGIYIFESDIAEIRMAQFVDNSAVESGGGVSTISGKDFRVDKCTFEENRSVMQGGGISCTRDTRVKIRRSDFVANQAVNSGGGVFVGPDCVGNFTDSMWHANDAGSQPGGGVMIKSGSVTIEAGNFTMNSAFSGSGVHADGGDVEVVGCIFIDNSARTFGAVGGVEARGNVRNSTFDHNIAQYGAAVGLRRFSNFELMDIIMVRNNVSSHGPCLLVETATASVVKSNFDGNVAGGSGGCFMVFKGNLTINDVRVHASRAEIVGGVLRMDQSKVNISNSQLSKNQAVLDGGAVEVTSGQLLVFNTSIEDCGAGRDGGAVHVSVKALLSIEGCVFTRNVARERGGGILATNNVTVTGRGVKISNNTAIMSGGGIFAEKESNVSMMSSDFTSNAAGDGGAFVLISSRATIEEGVFVNNSAMSFGGDGHLNQNAMLNVTGSRFVESRARLGGSIYGNNVTVMMTDVAFRGGKAEEYGGAVALSNGSTIAIIESIIIDTAAQKGGALSLMASKFMGRRLTVLASRAEENGGAMTAEISSTVLCVSCLFKDNAANSVGGAVALASDATQSPAFQFDRCSFTSNTATVGGGLHLLTHINRTLCTQSTDCANLILRRTTFTRNRASSSGGAIFASDLDVVRVDCSDDSENDLPDLDQQELSRLEVLNSLNKVCRSWKDNDAGTLGAVLTSSNIHIEKRVFYEDDDEGIPVKANRYTVRNHRSGSRLPVLQLTAFDALGQGPATAGSEQALIADVVSPDGLYFNGLHNVSLLNGMGRFPALRVFQMPGTYDVVFTFNRPSIPPFVLTVEIRNCIIGEYSIEEGTLCERCPTGSYNFYPQRRGQMCHRCPEGGDCNSALLQSKAGYWHKTPCSTHFQMCLTRRACDTVDREEKLMNITKNQHDCNFTEEVLSNYSSSQCREGYEGPLCGSCSESYGKTRAFHCEACHGRALSGVVVVLTLLFLWLVSGFAIKGSLPSFKMQQSSSSHRSHRSHRSNRWARLSGEGPPINLEMVEMYTTGRIPTHILEGRPDEIRIERERKRRQCELAKWKAAEIFKITINFLQVTAVAIAINVDWTKALVHMFEAAEFLGVVTSEAATRSADCLISNGSAIPRSALRMVLNILGPLLVAMVYTVIWTLRTIIIRAKPVYFAKRCALSVLVVSYLSYIAITKTAVNTLYCVDVHDEVDFTKDSITKYWAVDTSLRCYEGTHATLAGTIGWPLLVVFSLGFPLGTASMLITQERRNQLQNEWLFESAGFLYRAYQTKFVYWESMIMFRKATLAVVLVFAYPLGANLQGVLSVFVLNFALYCHCSCRPYRQEFSSLNHLEAVSLLISSLTFVSGLFFVDGSASHVVRILLTVTLIVLNAGVVLVFFVMAIRCAVQYCRLFLAVEEVPCDSDASDFKVLKVFVISRIRKICRHFIPEKTTVDEQNAVTSRTPISI